MKSQG
jgi:hypothetical protein